MNETGAVKNETAEVVQTNSDSGVDKKKKGRSIFKNKIDFSDRKTKKTVKRIIIWTIIAAILIAGYFVITGVFAPNKQAEAKISTAMVTRGDIEVTITGSGVVEAMEKYDIVPMVRGEILSADFEEGAIVEKDSVLYVVDNSDAQINIEKAQNAIVKADITRRSNQETLEDWTIKAPIDGYISALEIKNGDNVNSNTVICKITNDDILSVVIPFSSVYINDLYVGATAQLTSADYMTSNIYGTVHDIDRTPIRSGSGDVVYNVKIVLDNPGAISEGMSFTANVNGCMSAASGVSEVYETKTVTAKTSGEIVGVYYKNGDKVKAGAKIAQMTNQSTLDTITRSDLEYADLQLTLQERYEDLDDYTIKSPITGKVVTKTYKAGDTIDNTNSSVKLAVIADMSKMKFTMDVDELDISKIQLGQTVDVVADAMEDKTFVGRITQIIQEGESQNGVTTYPVEVVIDEPEGLMIGMNVTATVIVESKTDVLKVAVDAVTRQGGKSYVMKLKDDKMPKRTTGGQMPEGMGEGRPNFEGGSRPEGMPRFEGGSRPEGVPEIEGGNRPEGMTRPEGEAAGESNAANGESKAGQRGQMPEGMERPDISSLRGNMPFDASQLAQANYTAEDFERVEVEVGINSEDEVEIISGLSLGDIVRVTTSVSSSTSMMPMMGGMGGGMPGGMGGMPGGMGGGMPGGNRSGGNRSMGGGMPGGR